MQKDFDKELSPEVREKMKKNLVYVGIFSVAMLFAGFTSAYIVSMGDSFWLKFDIPKSFYISTAIILFSSITFELAKVFVKKNQLNGLKVFISLTLLFGILFIYFQFKGYGEMIDRGAYAVNNHIIVTEGRYGDYYELRYKGQFLEVDGNNYYLDGKLIGDSEMEEIQKYFKPFETIERNKPLSFTKNNQIELFYQQQLIQLKDGKAFRPDSTELAYVDLLRLNQLAYNIRDKRGDFFVKGVYGKDFVIYYKGKPLEYKDRSLWYQGRVLDKYLQIKVMDIADTATTYLYLISFVHLMHVLITLFYLVKLVTFSFTGRYNSSEYLSLKVGSIFWHFLGALWVYLLLFLLFIH